MDDPQAVGRRLREARERAGRSQRELAFPGCSAAYISRIEAGERTPSLQLIRELAQRLGVTEGLLAWGRDDAAHALSDDRLVEADVALRLDDTALAEELYAKAAKKAVDPAERGRALAGLGQLAFRHGEPREAISRFDDAIEADASLGAEPSLAETLGRAYAHVGELESAIAVFDRALAAARQHEDFVQSLRFSVLLANAFIDSGNFGRAEELLGRALASAHDSRDPLVHARLYWSQSRLHAMQNDTVAAARYARKALDILELTEHTFYTARAYQLLAHIEIDRDRPDVALDLLRKGVALMESSGNELELAKLRLEEARALADLGERDAAAELALATAGYFADVDAYDAGRAYGVAAGIFAADGERARAIELYELAAELLAASPNRYLVEVYRKLAELLEAEGRDAEALAVLKKAVEVQSAAGRPL